METVSQLLLLLKDLLLVSQTVAEGDVLQTVLVNLLVFGALMILPVLDHLSLELLSSA